MLTQCNLEKNVSLPIINGAMLIRCYASAHETFFMVILNTCIRLIPVYIHIVYVRAVAIILNILLRYLW